MPLNRQSIFSARNAATASELITAPLPSRVVQNMQRWLRNVLRWCVAFPGAAVNEPELREGVPMERLEVVCLGESMALFVPAQPGPVHEARDWTLSVGGAESNVASHLARAGLHARWVSALGNDSLGRAVRDRIAGVGVDVE